MRLRPADYPPLWTGQGERLSPFQGTCRKGTKHPYGDAVNTRLSPKALVFPQSETMLEYSLDESDDDHHICKEVAKDDSPRAIRDPPL
jgi:hypothetical protein